MFIDNYKLVRVFVDTMELKFLTSTFPGGEEYVRLTEDSIKEIRTAETVRLQLSSASNAAIMKMMVLADAIRRVNEFTKIVLETAYLPNGRQDRVCKPGESLSLEVFIRMVSLVCDKLVTIDVHNSYAVKNMCKKYSLDYDDITLNQDTTYPYVLTLDDKGDVVCNVSKFNLVPTSTGSWDEGLITYVFPDEGARLKYGKIIDGRRVSATKERIYDDSGKMIDLRHSFDNELAVTILHSVPSKLVVLDDICDGGATFISIAKALVGVGVSQKPILCISHGIFSKGVEGIKELLGVYDSIRLLKTSFNSIKLEELKLKS